MPGNAARFHMEFCFNNYESILQLCLILKICYAFAAAEKQFHALTAVIQYHNNPRGTRPYL